MAKQRRFFSPQEKVAAVRRHLLEKTPVSDLCDELGIIPNQFYQWQKQFFENGAAAFVNERSGRRAEDGKDRKIAHLEEKLLKKNEVMAELMEAHVQLKKELGEP